MPRCFISRAGTRRAPSPPRRSLFILVNSLFGLVGQVLKGGADRLASAVTLGLPLLIAVAIGGQIGSLLAARLLPPTWIRWLTAALTMWVGVRLLIG